MMQWICRAKRRSATMWHAGPLPDAAVDPEEQERKVSGALCASFPHARLCFGCCGGWMRHRHLL